MLTSTLSNSVFPKDKRMISQKFRSLMSARERSEFVSERSAFLSICKKVQDESKVVKSKERFYREHYDKSFFRRAEFKTKTLRKYQSAVKKLNSNFRVPIQKANKLYSEEQIRFEQNKRAIQKRGVPKFDLDMAAKLLEGKFHEDEEEEDNETFPQKKRPQQFEVARKPQRNKVQQFEEDAKIVLNDDESEKQNKDQVFEDEIPNLLRQEFNLPLDMQSYEINFEQVRQSDALKKRNRRFWSGQDVLEDSLDFRKATEIIDQINFIRVWPDGTRGLTKRARYFLRKIVKSESFVNLMTLAVVLNTVTLSLQSYGQSAQLSAFLDSSNVYLTWIFIVEMFSKLLAIGITKYAADRMNWLDAFVVILSLVEMIASAILSGQGTGLATFKTVRMFRTFRVFRVARLLRSLRSMQLILQVIVRSYKSFGYITMLMFLFIFIFTLLGRSLYAGEMSYPQGKPKSNYDTFPVAFLTVFQLLTTENWNQAFSDALRCTVNPFISAVYYVFWIFYGNFILLNLFLAILLDSFVEEEEDLQEESTLSALKEKKFQRALEKRARQDKKKVLLPPDQKQSARHVQEQHLIVIEDLEEEIDDLDEEQIISIFKQEGFIKKDEGEVDEAPQLLDVACNQSLFLFSRGNFLRVHSYKAVKSKIWESAVQGVIILSSIKLAIDTYSYTYSASVAQAMLQLDQVFSYIFLGECVVKVVALGFVMDEGSYLRDSWSQLDFFIVCTSMMEMALQNVKIPAIKVFRMLRTLRPLRFISHNVAMKMVVVALLESATSILNVLAVILVVYLIFAIMGVSFWAGQFFYCTTGQYTLHSRTACEVSGGTWARWDQNFDDVAQAMLTLYAVASLEGWPTVFYQAGDCVGVDEGPVAENSTLLPSIFLIIFILVGSMFLLNFFIGVLFMKFNEAQREEQRGLTPEDLSWMDIQRLILSAAPEYETTNIPSGWRRGFHNFVTSPQFDAFIMSAISLNVLQMALAYETMSAKYTEALDALNYAFAAVFVSEMVCKWIAFGGTYFKNAWNRLDCFIVVCSIFDVCLQIAGPDAISVIPSGPQIARVLRVLRVARMLKLAGKAENLQAILQTIQFSIPSLLNVFLLLMLVYFMAAVLANFLFQGVARGAAVTAYRNYENFLSSLVFVIILSTGENWPTVMYDCALTPAMGCVEGATCGTLYSYPYHCIFNMFLSNVMLNLFILVVIQQFEKYYLPKENLMKHFKSDEESFMKVWKEFTQDRYRCAKIKENQLTKFFRRLGDFGDRQQSLGFGAEFFNDGELKKNMLKMGIKPDGGYIYFNELLYRCMKRKYGSMKMSKRMQIFELRTQYGVYTQNLAYQSRTNNLSNEQIISSMIKKENGVNPFLSIMNFKISYKTWLRHGRREIRLRLRDKLIDDDLEVDAASGDEEQERRTYMVEIEEEEFIEETSDEDEAQVAHKIKGKLTSLFGEGATRASRLKKTTLKQFEKKFLKHRAEELKLIKFLKIQQQQQDQLILK